MIEHKLVPFPKKVELGNANFVVTDNTKIVVNYSDTDEKFVAEELSRRVKEISGKNVGIINTDDNPGSYIKFVKDKRYAVNAYRLQIKPDGIVVRYSDADGRFYAVMTLAQLVSKSGEIPQGEIYDYPDLKIRAISDDISRGQVSTVPHFKRIIRTLAEYKINYYFMYIEDMFKFEFNLKIGENRGALTPEEVKDIVDYARKYRVIVVPLFESLGHQLNLVNMPEYEPIAEWPGKSYLFNPADPKTLEFMDKCYAELSKVFTGPVIHCGLDETDYVGKGRSKDTIDKIGYDQMMADYYNSLNRIAKKYGKELWMYSDLIIKHPGIEDKIDKDIVLVNFTFYSPNSGDKFWDEVYTSIPLFIKKGFRVIVSPSILNFLRVFPRYGYAYKTIADLIQYGYQNKAAGSMTASWCDHGAENFREFNWYGYAIAAEISWNAVKPVKQETFYPRFAWTYFGDDSSKLGEVIYRLGQVEVLFDGMYTSFWDEKMFEGNLNSREQESNNVKPELLKVRDMLADDKGKRLAVRNKNSLEYISFAVERIEYFCELVPMLKRVNEWAAEAGKLTMLDNKRGELVEECIKMLSQIREEIFALRIDFETLWRWSCKPEGLDYNLSRFDKFISQVDTKIEEIKKLWS